MKKLLVMILTCLFLVPVIGCEVEGINPGTGPDSSTPSENGTEEIQFDDYPQKAKELFEGLWAIDDLVWIYHYIDKRNAGQSVDLQKIKGHAEGAIPQVEKLVSDHQSIGVSGDYLRKYRRISNLADYFPATLEDLINAIEDNNKEQINRNLDIIEHVRKQLSQQVSDYYK